MKSVIFTTFQSLIKTNHQEIKTIQKSVKNLFIIYYFGKSFDVSVEKA